MDDCVFVLDVLDNAADQPVGTLRCCVDRDELERSQWLSGRHFVWYIVVCDWEIEDKDACKDLEETDDLGRHRDILSKHSVTAPHGSFSHLSFVEL